MAMACFRLFTWPPFPLRPERSVPLFRRRMALLTLLLAAFPYRAIRPSKHLVSAQCLQASDSKLLMIVTQRWTLIWRFRTRHAAAFKACPDGTREPAWHITPPARSLL